MSWFFILTVLFIFSWFFLFLLVFPYNFVRILSLYLFIFFFLISSSLLLFINKSIFWYQASLKFYHLFFFKMSYLIALDSVSIFLIVLSSFILLFCFLIYWSLRYKITLYSGLLFFSLWLLINVFSISDLFFFYMFFEGIVIPMFLIIVYEVVVVVKYMRHINFLFIHY